MEWIKIFPSEADARLIFREDAPQLIIIDEREFASPFIKINFSPFRTAVHITANL